MTFKEELTIKANEEALRIDGEIERIKKAILRNVTKREYVVELIEPHTTFAIGGSGNFACLFIPKHVEPEKYNQLFIDKFKELGFADKDMLTNHLACKDYDLYSITLKW